MLSDDTIVRSSSDAVGCALGDGLAILDTRRNKYFSLNPVGAFIWKLLDRPIAVRDLCDRVVSEFDVDHDRCRADVQSLVRQLQSNDLVVVG